jgi:hypothetical protein
MSCCSSYLANIYFIFNVPPPTNITKMLVNWLNGINKNTKNQIRCEFLVGLFGIALVASDTIFVNKKRVSYYLQVMLLILDPYVVQFTHHRGAGVHGIFDRFAQDIFNQQRWWSSNRTHDAHMLHVVYITLLELCIHFVFM